MKKKRIILLSLVLIIIFAMTGCGDGKADSQGDTQQTDENASDENVDSSAALNVENDTFTVDDLLSSVGSEETGLLTILGATEEAETYEANIFGQKATTLDRTVLPGFVPAPRIRMRPCLRQWNFSQRKCTSPCRKRKDSEAGYS